MKQTKTRTSWTQSLVIESLSEALGPSYDLSKVVFTRMDVPVTIICKEHGSFLARPSTIIHRGSKCNKCSTRITANKQRKTKATFIAESKLLWGPESFDYSKVDYKTAKLPVTLICKKHNREFNQAPTNHLRKNHLWHGCKLCEIEHTKVFGPAILYYLYHKPTKKYKIGVTTTSLELRFKHTFTEFDILKTFAFDTAADAYLTEELILTTFKSARVYNTEFSGTGKSEFFSSNILNINLAPAKLVVPHL